MKTNIWFWKHDSKTRVVVRRISFKDNPIERRLKWSVTLFHGCSNASLELAFVGPKIVLKKNVNFV